MTSDHTLRLIEVEMDRFKDTRSIQWKLNLTFWGLIVGITYIIQKGDLNLGEINMKFVCGLFFLLYAVFIILNQNSLITSKRLWYALTDKIQQPGRPDDHITFDFKPYRRFSWKRFTESDVYWMFFYLSTTGLLLFFLLKVHANSLSPTIVS